YNIFPVSVYCFFFTNTPTPTIYTLSLHDALPICDLVHDPLDTVDLAEGELQVLVEQVVVLLGVEPLGDRGRARQVAEEDGHLLADRKSTRLNSSHLVISYAVFCLKKKKNIHNMKQ